MDMFRIPTLRSFFTAFFLLLTSLQPLTAEAALVSWGLKFFGGGGNVGRGYFSYDDATQDFIAETPFVPTEGFLVDAALTTLSARVLGENFGYNGAFEKTVWWADENNAPGQRIDDRSESFINDFWVFGVSGPTEQRSLALLDLTESVTGQLWSGRWSLNISGSPDNPAGIDEQGSWEARRLPAPIPVPAALPLFASALAALGLVSFRRRASALPA